MYHARFDLGKFIPAQWSQAVHRLPSLAMFGLDVVNASAAEALDWLCGRLDARVPTRVAFLNAHCANVAAADLGYRAALASADVLLPDGSGIALMAKMKRKRLAANLNGTDFIPALCARLAQSGHSVFLLGGQAGVADEAAASLQRQSPGLRIAGTHDGFFAADDEGELLRRINGSGAAVLLVAMGVPLQDEWLARMAPRLNVTLSFGVGALFDFLAQRVSRAPFGLRRLGLEWTWRLAQEPARMWRRYILGNPIFVLRAVLDSMPSDTGIRERLDEILKRTLDVAASGLGLLVIGPLLLVMAAIVCLTSRGPAFLRQTRIGQDGVPFTMYKVRSMYIDAEARRAALVSANEHGAAGLTFKLRRDPRITGIGRFLRKSSIDELPQLWNVLRGDMSLVGPRPQLPGEVARYQPTHFRRLAAKPGLTCLWQIGGRADVAFEQQFELDLTYLRTRNVLVDLGILLRTVPAVLMARGAY
jgi:exopolysaccharide biosynthesis WecB/TagA/CpsF family protein